MKLEQYITEAISTGKHKKAYSDLDELNEGERVRVKSKKDILDIPGIVALKNGEYVIEDLLRPNGKRRNYYINPEMFDYCGRVFYVKSINRESGIIFLFNDRKNWSWIIELLEIL